jgi:hypothetical protein
VRDLDLLALAVALAIDPARSWHLDNLLPAFLATAPPGARADMSRRPADAAGN